LTEPLVEIPMAVASDDFAECWRAAGGHLQKQAEQGPHLYWLRCHVNPPFLEHLSFRLGNQLFFVRIEDVDHGISIPGARQGLLAIADGCIGHPCIMPMRRGGGVWSPVSPLWGLIHARSGEHVHPPALITDDLIEMSDWELHDFAVQIVRDQLVKEGRKIMTWVSHPGIDPALWFHGDTGREWVIIRAARYPVRADPPANWQQIAERCARLGKVGHFASVSVARADEAFDPEHKAPVTPIWRGHTLVVKYIGLETGK
jgi:hypothetical protein